MYQSMKAMLAAAHQQHYAVMAINAFNIESAKGVIAAAEKKRAPIIIDLLQDHLLTLTDANFLLPSLIKLAEAACVPVAINLDHGHDIGHLKYCLHQGISSVMCDASAYQLEDNIRITKEIVGLAQLYGASVEAELGNFGVTEGEGAAFTEASMYTNPKDAIRFIQETGVDCLAVSYGSTHGNYPKDYVPTFHFEIVEEISAATGLPLVLHGGSGSGEANIKRSIQAGISKMNVGTDYMNAQRAYVAKRLADNPEADYPQLMHESWQAGAQVVEHYIDLSESAGRA